MGGNQTVAGQATFNNFVESVASPSTLTFVGGLFNTINGSLDLQGAPGALLKLRPAIPPAPSTPSTSTAAPA